MLTLLVVTGLVSGSLWSQAAASRETAAFGYGLPAFEDGRWWGAVTGVFLAVSPWGYVPVLLGVVGLGVFAERRLGTARALVAVAACHVAGVAGSAGLLHVASGHGWVWADSLARLRDVGPSAGFVGAAAAATATLGPPWRGRLRVVLLGWAGLSVLYVGGLPDLEHLLAALTGLLLGPLLLGRRPRVTVRALSGREHRLLICAFLLVSALAAVLSSIAPVAGPLPELVPVAGAARLTAVHASHLVPGGALAHAVAFLVLARVVTWGRRSGWWLTVGALGLVSTVQVVAAAGLVSRDHACWPVLVDNAVLNLAGLAVVLSGRHAFGHVSPRRATALPESLRRSADEQERDRATSWLTTHGSAGRLSWMTTWRGNRWFFSERQEGYVAHRVGAGVALALGDPVSATGDRSALLLEFARRARRDGLVPCAFAASAETAAAARRIGWRSLEVAQEAVIDLGTLDFVGKRWQDVRTALNQAARRGITFRLVRLADEPEGVRAQVARISRGWLEDKRLPELGFTLGGVEEALDPRVRVGLAVDADGRVHGVTSWLPVLRPGDGAVVGWTLDVMRRGPAGFRAVMDFLIASACLAFRDEGCDTVSLSAAPLARVADQPRHGLESVLDRLGQGLEPYYGFRSLHAFKAKFQPRYEPLHLLYPDEAALPRIGLALVQAYLACSAWRLALELVHPPRPATDRSSGVHEPDLSRPHAVSLSG
ncbi:hypothetical protein N865_12090 [Intrasporangium oryzae NRRL B-24470]|uniref:Phosphatidylglycerol lysyltransferase C-terminal domain-containing protein n=1 Tax=Intrasporangium oryzae NRRL B-24470 TaxID=1386089 RepID=W9G491_9MICO|nr:DUF2156 domain-containing protein [Intrasporangium oryzae]EWT00961.1 hypothetical protein N865_12090 [Intrasporangium oryzae NRRL B-24470]